MKKCFFFLTLDRYLIRLLIIVSVFLPSIILILSWNTPILDHHGYRQTQTAITSYYIFNADWPFNFLTPLLGKPWQIPMEYPVYQIIVNAVSKNSYLSLENSGRLVGLIFFYLSILPIISLFNYSKFQIRLIVLTIFTAPILLFFSTRFLIESSLSFFLITSFYFFIAAIKKNRLTDYLLFFFFSSILGLQKITGFIIMFFGCLLYITILLLTNSKTRLSLFLAFWVLIFSLIIPFLWLVMSEKIKVSTYILQFLTSEALRSWNFGSFTDRLNLFSLFKVFVFRLLVLGGSSGIIFFILFRFLRLTFNATGFVLIFMGLLGPLLFFNLHLVHDYYFFSSLPIFITGIIIQFDFKNFNINQRFELLLLSSVFFTNIFIFCFWYYPLIGKVPKTHLGMYLTGKILKKSVPVNSKLLIVGADWDATIPYISQKFALMLPSWESSARLISPRYNNSYYHDSVVLKNLRNFVNISEIGAVVLCKTRPSGSNMQTIDKFLLIPNLSWNTCYECKYLILNSESRNLINKFLHAE